jgi:hypothetical protein
MMEVAQLLQSHSLLHRPEIIRPIAAASGIVTARDEGRRRVKAEKPQDP